MIDNWFVKCEPSGLEQWESSFVLWFRMFGSSLLRNSLTYLKNKAANQCWASNIAAVNQLQAKNLQETALAENCILVDEFDRAIGQCSKRDCHRVNDDGHIKLHRAFSVFLFNSNGDMLIQKRSSHKVIKRKSSFGCH